MVEDAAVTHTRHARRFVRQERLASGPFIVGEFVAHDFEAPVRELEARAARYNQPQNAYCPAANALILLLLLDAQPSESPAASALSSNRHFPSRICYRF